MRYISKIISSPSLRTLGVVATGNLMVAIIGGLGGLLQARWIDPEVFGEFRKYGILTSYFYIGLVLVHDGLMRQYPYLIGKGDKDEALKVAASAKWWYLMLSCCFSFLFLCLFLKSVLVGDFRSAVGWAAQIPCIWCVIYGAYLGVMYRTSLDFRRLSLNNVISSTLGFIALALVKVWGYWGLVGRFIIANALSLFINQHYQPVRVKAVFNIKRLVELAKISLPLAIPNYVHTSCLGASVSFVILKYCGQSALGVYGVALTFQGMAMTFTAALNQIFVTKLTCKFGETDDVFSCLKYAKVPTILSVIAASGLALAFCMVIGPFICVMLPKYEESIPVIRILSLSLPIAAAQLPFVVIQAALWYKSVAVLAAIRFCTCLFTVALLPKRLDVIAACVILGELSSVVVGFGILSWTRWRQIK